MKKHILSIGAICIAFGISAQNGNGSNTFPTTGNVGIGTAAPTEKLRVAGDMRVDSSMVVQRDATFESSARVEEDLELLGQLFTPNMASGWNTEESKWLVLEPEGQVKSMNKDLVAQSLYANECFLLTDPSGNSTQQSSPTWKSSLSPNGQLGYLTTGSICPAFVGIGFATPRVPLDVNGTVFANKIAIGQDPTTLSGWFHLKVNPIATDATVMKVENNQRQLFNLDNTGLLRTREVLVDAQAWPDYVFQPNYALMPLYDIERFIQSEGHLPNIPKASEIEQNGQNLGEMNKLLLEKVEELTLHLIEQQKQIDALKIALEEK